MAITCPRRRDCWEWARVYINYCICSARDEGSFALGLISVISWSVAEIPQIITNYKEKSIEGLSLGFLITWIVGDLFNLFGCILEPATLPTQFYMAVLYTMTTSILAAQTVYYGHIYPRLKYKRVCHKDSKEHQPEAVEKVIDADRLSSPIPLPAINVKSSPGRELYYMSARSLSRSHTPTAGSFLVQRMTPPSHTRSSVEEPLLSAHVSAQSASPPSSKSLLCLVSVLMFIATFNSQLSAFNKLHIEHKIVNQGFVIQIGRKLLQVNAASLGESGIGGGSRVGTFLGWAMATIYMGGRLPQICLNIRRGNVEGLNPFMFMFALVGNSTYVASILVESTDWSRIRPNLPWLVDAAGCVLLDTFILIQFIYFCYWAPQDAENKHENLNAS
ncbi:PREDICTED: probable vacuolar amino acid transporter YPQ2 [Theobroma cacao]|uniref:Probable vacuolar amino acid transporter YPQ2 n=1 Tax=Theobroma cacao TaxID=3641 RepID=A0AB32WJQ4_THECC|nr:PREDICTED: probable vacuolar amino acid transporter YPQ2 [Theobroma cacao]XP_017977773.1 PREDICTED: probable vacuolar amino acid transporter YPQ2 [Theobroma cacao]XP_017977774.1 PREDICTED: probable vacuolar amino acid transporter YPQ2 [Theobroma cacao]